MKISSSLGVLLIPLVVFSVVGYLQAQSKPWMNGLSNVAEAAYLDGESAIAGVATEQLGENTDISVIQPEVYWIPIGTIDLNNYLASKNITVFPEDIIKSFPNPNLQVGGAIKIYRAQAISVNDAGRESIIHTWKPTIIEALNEHSIELGEKDKLDPAENSTALSDQRLIPLKVIITRVEETDVVVKETIPHQTKTKLDNTLEKGVKVTVESGLDGLKELTYRVRRENGLEVSRKLVNTEITVDAITEIIKEGTKIKVYGSGVATWYTKHYNHVAAHNGLPRGTRVRVVNINNGKSTVVTVVGGGLYTDAAIDLSYDAFSDLADPGVGKVAVQIEKVYD